MRTRQMTAKHSGNCTEYAEGIESGDAIYWSRGRGARHVDCETARLRNTVCTSCNGAGSRWNGAPCQSCDGTGSREVQEFARAGGRPSRCWKCRQIVKGRPYRQHGVAFCNTDCASSTKAGVPC